ncbi:DNA polymerase III subunit beta [Phyllobacterium endophyticum]|uniref:Beta sliding clamp n=1 Tax=Phyllobacterium endophyticum TaxID=1149773 RepID=A0A2P7B0H1_9HYPH|nr:DNA polymerase III subunit beta [Phyllobacterium endophyticum]MBB3235354.1 DNA polymerase-3 subunit beta [Phyllobacterium endophyticum]PSH59963.1 DNA polymerase III subunit beta [Phyllobacterium endophyticum]TXR49981.1 DNA polymerase III subunit beta [Phyllobacterium endophyticum]TYR42133.1 DNA polymerase III subunit beta [Phyllobacterium endophyticum]
MRVTLERSNLLKSLNHVHRVVERRNTIPILSNVLLNADGASLALKATDLDLEVTEATAAQVNQAGATTVPAHLLYDIVRKLPDGAEVLLATNADGNSMAVTSGRSSFRLQCLPQSDFPELTAGTFTHTFRMPSTALKGLIDRTQFAISTEETRYYLNGIYLHAIESDGALKLRAVATDGHRLARAELDAPSGVEGMPGIIIPRKTVAELQKLVDDPDIAVTVELSETKIRFTIGSVVLTSKLIDGTFPDYQRVIPSGNDKKLTIDRQSFASAVDRVSTISSERGRAVKLTIADGQLTLTVNNPDSGSATDELAADYDSDPIEIGFNAKYLLDITGQLTGSEAIFMLADAGSPTLVRDTGDENALYVLMPMRV